MGQSVVVLGAQWGDEGMGKIVDLLNTGVPNSPNMDNTGKVMRFQVVAPGTLPAPAGAPQSPAPTMPADGAVLPLLENTLSELTKEDGEQVRR